MRRTNWKKPYSLRFASSSQTAGANVGSFLPADRLATVNWRNAGLAAIGGIPTTRTQFGSTLTPSGGDDTTQIQTALNGCGANQFVLLGAGTFLISTTNYGALHFANNNTTLRGSGAGVTILRKTNGGALARSATALLGTGTSSGVVAPGATNSTTIFHPTGGGTATDPYPVVVIGTGLGGTYTSTSTNLTADVAQGAMSVTVASASGFSVGQSVLLDELTGATYQNCPIDGYAGTIQVLSGDRVTYNIHNPTQAGDDGSNVFTDYSRNDRVVNELKEIASIAGNVITFTSPVIISYRVSHTAQLTFNTQPYMTGLGLENMTVMGGGDSNIRFENCSRCWGLNLESTFPTNGPGIRFMGAFRCELRHCYVHQDAWPVPTGGGYNIGFDYASSECLIEDCISIDCCKVLTARAAGAGCVVGYCYMDDAWDGYGNTNDGAWMESGINGSHFIGPHHILFEGNWGHNFDSDYTHGGSIYHTIFRNYFPGYRRDFYYWDNNPGPNNATQGTFIRCAGLAAYSWNMSFVGNVLGYAAMPRSQWNISGGGTTWIIGYDPERFNMPSLELGTVNTCIRDGNYEYFSNTQTWYNTPATFAIPSSMYKTSAPDIFVAHGNTWPWVDPSTGTTLTLPAKARLEAGTPNGP